MNLAKIAALVDLVIVVSEPSKFSLQGDYAGGIEELVYGVGE